MSVFEFTDEQDQLRDMVRRLLEDRAPLTHARNQLETGTRWDAQLWADMAGLGLQGLALPVAVGGAGAGVVERSILAEEFGRVLHGGPFLSTAVLAAEGLLALEDPVADDVLAQIAAGEATVALAVCETSASWIPDDVATTASDLGDGRVRLDGVKYPVVDGAEADLLLVAAQDGAGISLCLVDRTTDGVDRVALRGLDPTRPLARIRLDGATATPLGRRGRGWDAVVRARDATALHLAAEAVGAGTRCVELTSAHARTRHQFGRPIGRFQAVKHPLADVYVRLELARAATYWAAWQEPGSDDHAAGVAVACSLATEAFEQAARDMIQLHGGIGFTWEHDAHLFLRRARVDRTIMGTPQEHRRRLASRLDQGRVGQLIATASSAGRSEVLT